MVELGRAERDSTAAEDQAGRLVISGIALAILEGGRAWYPLDARSTRVGDPLEEGLSPQTMPAKDPR